MLERTMSWRKITIHKIRRLGTKDLSRKDAEISDWVSSWDSRKRKDSEITEKVKGKREKDEQRIPDPKKRKRKRKTINPIKSGPLTSRIQSS